MCTGVMKDGDNMGTRTGRDILGMLGPNRMGEFYSSCSPICFLTSFYFCPLNGRVCSKPVTDRLIVERVLSCPSSV